MLLSMTCACSANPGLWWVAHGNGDPLQVRLYEDHTAWSDFPSNNPGRWRLHGERVVCLWADGWKEVFVPVDGGWQKLGYKPDAPLEGPPSNVTRAHLVSPRADGWFGFAPKE